MVTVDTLAGQPDSAGGPRRVGTYVVPNDWDGARRRLRLLEAWADPATTRRLAVTGVGPGWHCLEVGAGGGSITDWLCQQVGSTGTVMAVDIDTRFVDELERPNLAVHRQDVVTEPVPRHQFDLVHTRAVLSHLPARHEVLADLIAALRPGGWLLIEEIDFFPIHACGTGLYRDMIIALEGILSPAGLNCHWARGVAPLLQDGGLTAITAAADVGFYNGGSSAAQFLAVSFEQLRDQLIAGGCTADDLDRIAVLLDDPTVWFPNMALVGVAGQRPRSAGAVR
jgi:SAM-dependent methyltransferase